MADVLTVAAADNVFVEKNDHHEKPRQLFSQQRTFNKQNRFGLRKVFATQHHHAHSVMCGGQTTETSNQPAQNPLLAQNHHRFFPQMSAVGQLADNVDTCIVA